MYYLNYFADADKKKGVEELQNKNQVKMFFQIHSLRYLVCLQWHKKETFKIISMKLQQ